MSPNSENSTPTKSSTSSSPSITPLHDPAHQAKVMPQVKPLGTANPNPVVPGQTVDPATAAGLGQKALLAKRFAKANKPTVSPTDQLQSPCTQKLAGAKTKHFQNKGGGDCQVKEGLIADGTRAKPASLAASFTAVRDSNAAPARTDF